MKNGSMPFLKIEGLYKNYGSFVALKNIHLCLEQGEVVCIIGPSGSGKSTLVRTINQLETYEAGKIYFKDTEIHPSKNLDQLRQKIGMVFQGFHLFPHLTVLENLTLAPTRVKKIHHDVAKSKAIELLKKVGIDCQSQKYPSSLSGGQQQRVAIARALAMEPEIMLFDEPTSALDPEMISEVLNVIKNLTTSGMTMMIVTHEMNFAREVADRIVFMVSGEIIEISTPDVFFSKPKTERAANFLAKFQNQ